MATTRPAQRHRNQLQAVLAGEAPAHFGEEVGVCSLRGERGPRVSLPARGLQREKASDRLVVRLEPCELDLAAEALLEPAARAPEVGPAAGGERQLGSAGARRECRAVEVPPEHRDHVTSRDRVLEHGPRGAPQRKLLEEGGAGELAAQPIQQQVGQDALAARRHQRRPEEGVGSPPAREHRHLQPGGPVAHRQAREPVAVLLQDHEAARARAEVARGRDHEVRLEERVAVEAPIREPAPGLLVGRIEVVEVDETGGHSPLVSVASAPSLRLRCGPGAGAPGRTPAGACRPPATPPAHG